MSDRLFLSVILVALFFGAFLFINLAQAQEADTSAPPTDASITGEGPPVDITTSAVDLDGNGVADIIQAEEIPEDVLRDFDITIEDMQANRAAIMPDSPFHFFKRIGRAVTEAVTFDPVAKAELRLNHANDMLAETIQMIEKDGMKDVDHKAVSTSIKRYEGKVDQIRGQIDDVKAEKIANPEAVNTFLNNFVDNQLKQQKVLGNIAEEVIGVKEANAAAGEEVNTAIEQIISTVEDAKGGAMASFTDVLSGVEDTPEDMADRLSAVMDEQDGSDFKHLNNLEILESVYEKAPETAKEAIQQARDNTIQKFEVRISTLPPAVRAEKFEKYIKYATVDETRLMTLLDELKQSTGIPSDILAKLEEAKEIAVRKFEQRLEFIDDSAVEQIYFDRFDAKGVDGLIAMEEFKNRMSADSEIGQRMAQVHDESVDAFKKMFSDVDSQFQAERFQSLTEEMMNNPNPKTFKLLQELESQVMNDPAKKAFLAQTELAMKNQFETRFRREGDMFMNRISSLDPNDIGILENFDFGDDFHGRFVEKNTEHFQDYMRGMNEPDHFDMFRDRFSNVPEFIINEIKDRDTGFQDSMMFKMRKMEELRSEKEREIQRASLDYEEREINYQIDKIQQQKEDEFWNKLNQISQDDFDARKELWDTKINDQYSLVEQRFNEQKRIFEERLKNDPFCDEICQQIQIQFMDQQMRHEKGRMADDLVRERNRIEREKQQREQNDPLFGKCDSPESCDQYCKNNPTVPGCEWASQDSNIQSCPPPSWWDFGVQNCVFPDNMRPEDQQFDQNQQFDAYTASYNQCGPGEFFDRKTGRCVIDPYYNPPDSFIDCPFGDHWNERGGFCEQDFEQCNFFVQVRDCNPGERPIPPDPNDQCSQPSCISKMQFCPDISAMMPMSCPEGQYREMVQDSNGCPGFGDCVSNDDIAGPPDADCPDVYEPVCGMNGKTYDNECQSNSYGVGVQYYGGCESGGFQNCGWGEFYEPMVDKCIKDTDYVPHNSGSCDYGWKWTGEICARDSGISGGCAPACETPCYNGTFCVYDNMGCATECSPECGPNEFYDQWQGGCVPSNTPPPTSGWCGDGVCQNGEYCPMDCEQLDPSVPPNPDQGCGSLRAWCDSYWSPNVDNWGDDSTSRCARDHHGGMCAGSSAFDDHNVGDYCDGICNNGEDSNSCPSDCDQTPTSCPPTRFNEYTSGYACDYNECSQGCVFDMQGCPYGCSGDGGGYCGDNYCSSAETMMSCPNDCGSMSAYPGDENSCPGFAYSMWDNNGNRYCQLNNQQSCSGNYPDYLDESSYRPEYCDSNTTTGVCPSTIYNNYTNGMACNSNECTGGCNYDSNGCPDSCWQSGVDQNYCGDGYCSSEESNSNCATDCPLWTGCGSYTAEYSCQQADGCTWCAESSTCNADGYSCSNSATSCNSNTFTTEYGACDYSYCSDGCTFDNTGCPDGCMSSSGYCGDGSCDSSETGTSCPSDCQTISCISTMYNGFTNSSDCSFSSCPSGCEFDSAGCPTSCIETGYCGDGTCDANEDTYYCPYDCGSAACGDGICNGSETETSCSADCASVSIPSCGNNVCENGETMYSCPMDCGDSSFTACNNNGNCDYDESMTSCPNDCSGSWTGCESYQDESSCLSADGCVYCAGETWPCYTAGHVCGSGQGYCGDGSCNNGESESSCPGDCGSNYSGWCGDGTCDSNEDTSWCSVDCGGAGVACPSTMYNDYTTGNTCSSSACPNGCIWDSNSCPTSCDTPSTYCGDGTCDSSEDSWSCPTDCGVAVACGDGACDSSETAESCPSDCGGGSDNTPCTSFSAQVGEYCDPSAGICCADSMCTSMSGPGTCEGTVMGESVKRNISKYNPLNLLKPFVRFLGASN